MHTHNYINNIRLYNNKACDSCIKLNKLCSNKKKYNSSQQSVDILLSKYGPLINQLNELDYDILITGFPIIECLLSDPCNFHYDKKCFKLQQFSIYIKQFSIKKIYNLYKKIYNLYKDNIILLIREVSRIIILVCDKNYKTILQVSIETIFFNTWEEVFESIPTDIFSVAYSVKLNRFIIHKNKFHLFKNGMAITHNNKIYCTAEFKNYLGQHSNKKCNNGLNSFYKYYKFDDYKKIRESKNIFISSNMKTILININIILYALEINKIEINKVINDINSTEDSDGEYCSIIMQKADLFMANKLCSHSVSLISYMNCKIKKCPFCRVEFKPKIFNILKDERPK